MIFLAPRRRLVQTNGSLKFLTTTMMMMILFWLRRSKLQKKSSPARRRFWISTIPSKAKARQSRSLMIFFSTKKKQTLLHRLWIKPQSANETTTDLPQLVQLLVWTHSNNASSAVYFETKFHCLRFKFLLMPFLAYCQPRRKASHQPVTTSCQNGNFMHLHWQCLLLMKGQKSVRFVWASTSQMNRWIHYPACTTSMQSVSRNGCWAVQNVLLVGLMSVNKFFNFSVLDILHRIS